MKLQLIHTDNYNILIMTHQYLVVVDDSKIKIGDIVLEEYVDGTKGLEQIDTLNDIDVLLQKRLTHHLPLNDAPVLEGIELLPPLEDEAERLAKELIKCSDNIEIEIVRTIWINGYNKAKETHSNSDDDMVEFGEWCENLQKDNKEIRRNNPSVTRKELLQLWKEQQPKLPTGFDTETKQYIY